MECELLLEATASAIAFTMRKHPDGADCVKISDTEYRHPDGRIFVLDEKRDMVEVKK